MNLIFRYLEMISRYPEISRIYGKPFGFLFSIFRYRELFPDIGNWNSRYRKINFRYREMIDFPISGYDFRISGIDFPISGNVLDFPISGNQFQISENRHPTEAGYSASLQHRPTTPPPINNGPKLYQPHLLVEFYDFSKSISATNNNHATDDFAQKCTWEICGAELMSSMILTRTEHWDNYMYHYITICIFVEHFDMPFKNRDNNYDKTYQSHSTWNPLK